VLRNQNITHQNGMYTQDNNLRIRGGDNSKDSKRTGQLYGDKRDWFQENRMSQCQFEHHNVSSKQTIRMVCTHRNRTFRFMEVIGDNSETERELDNWMLTSLTCSEHHNVSSKQTIIRMATDRRNECRPIPTTTHTMELNDIHKLKVFRLKKC